MMKLNTFIVPAVPVTLAPTPNSRRDSIEAVTERGPSVGEGQLSFEQAVDTRHDQPGLGRSDRRLGPGKGADEVDRIATGVHQRPPARSSRQRMSRLSSGMQNHARCGAPGRARPMRDDLEHPRGERMVAIVEGLHHDELRSVRCGGDLLGLGGVGGERLLAEHVLAGGDRRQRPAAVQAVRQRVVDRVDRRGRRAAPHSLDRRAARHAFPRTPGLAARRAQQLRGRRCRSQPVPARSAPWARCSRRRGFRSGSSAELLFPTQPLPHDHFALYSGADRGYGDLIGALCSTAFAHARVNGRDFGPGRVSRSSRSTIASIRRRFTRPRSRI